MTTATSSQDQGLSTSSATMKNPWAINLLDADEIEFRIQSTTAIMMPAALRLLAQLGITASTGEEFELLDTACGSGLVADAIYRTVSKEVLDGKKTKLLCGDISEELVQITAKRAEKEGWKAVTAKVLDAKSTVGQVESGRMDYVTCNFGLHVIDDPDAVVKDTHRILKPAGKFAFSTMHMDNQGWIPVFRAAFAELSAELGLKGDSALTMADPMPMHLYNKGRWGDPDWISAHLPTLGFRDVTTEVVEHTMRVEDTASFTKSFSPAILLIWSMWGEEKKGMWPVKKVEEMVVRKIKEMDTGGWTLNWKFLVARGTKA